MVCLGVSIPSTTPGYPLRTDANSNRWEPLKPLVAVVHTIVSHLPGGKRRPLAFQPHFGGRSRKPSVVDQPYTVNNPCKVKTLGKGPDYLGFYQREEHLTRAHRRKGRGPRNQSLYNPPMESGA